MENQSPNPGQQQPKKEFTSEDLNSLYKGPVGSPLTTRMPDMTRLTPEQAQAVGQEWHHSKIVRFGASFLFLVWAGYIISTFKIAGAVGILVVAAGLVGSYRWYAKTKSNYAWRLFGLILLFVVAFMVLVTRSKG